MEENKEILELLKQIERSNRRQVRNGRLLCVLALAAALCCGAVLVLVLNILPQVDTVITQMQTVLGNLEEASGQLTSLDLESMVSDVNTLVTTGQQSLEQTMEKLNSIDIATLNQAIEDLASVVEPLAKLSSMFR